MFVLNPDPYSTPTYRIGTFKTYSILKNANIPYQFSQFSRNYFDYRFGSDNWLITKNGREAMSLAFKELGLPREKNVTILTPSNNFYISGCVTSTIEMFTKWDRKRSENTSAYFVNHEFGYLFPQIAELKKYGLPVIEDCCTTFFSQDAECKVGLYGDFSLFSFPKFFNIQIGGLLVGKDVGKNEKLINSVNLSKEEIEYILKVVGHELSQKDEILKERREIFEYATFKFSEMGFLLRFPNNDSRIVPSVLLLNNKGIVKDLQEQKQYLFKHGIQNSVFYGEDAFFLPCHQNLSKADIDYFAFVVTNHILSQN
jgi:dTDP-4-amino-4,6-dideoxygalactose transaminase